MKIKSKTGYQVVFWGFVALTLIAYVNLFATLIYMLTKLF